MYLLIYGTREGELQFEEEEEGLSLLRERGFPNLEEELKEGGRFKE